MSNWAEYRIHLHGRAAMEQFLAQDLPALVEGRWWFIRYWLGGPHLRLRVPSDMADAGFVQRLSQRAEALAGGVNLDRGAFYASCAFDGRSVDVDEAPWHVDGTVEPCAYQPETIYYGTGEELARHEALFCEASRLAVGLIRASADGQQRLAVGADLLAGLLHHAQGQGMLDTVQAAYARFLAPFDFRQDRRRLASIRAGSPGRRWAMLLELHKPAFARRGGETAAWKMVMHHHLLLNRIGIGPRQEAAIFDHFHLTPPRELADA